MKRNDNRVKDLFIDFERKMKASVQDMLEDGKKDTMNTMDKKIAYLDAEVKKYYQRMNRLDNKATNTLLEVQSTNERFAKKVEEVTDRWLSAMGKEEKVRV